MVAFGSFELSSRTYPSAPEYASGRGPTTLIGEPSIAGGVLAVGPAGANIPAKPPLV
jgi:hypothetical protein